uniref:RBR-type E3 ubiquitin transferase n=1 Tax=Cicer arietinum TaxID=3827 RepID=A0A3Q7XG65_CICAR|nr:probable E3 ubiquitin-protein ligase ARI9 [Cicer arietinum]
MGNKVSMLHCVPIKTKRKTKGQILTIPTLSSLSNLRLDNSIEANETTIATPLPLQETPFYDCQICYESKPPNFIFNIEGCTHFYCTQCTMQYIVSKLDANQINIFCPEPGCSAVLNPRNCKPILPNNLLNWWEKALIESMIPEKNKFYCPYHDCSTLLILSEAHDNNNDQEAGVGIIKNTQCVCPLCKRKVCVNCKSPWHVDMTCTKFQKMKRSNHDDLMLDLVKKKNWRKCPNCGRIIEKTHGCGHMQCWYVHFISLLLLFYLHNVFPFIYYRFGCVCL